MVFRIILALVDNFIQIKLKIKKMQGFLQIFLPIYFLLFFGIAFIAKSFFVAKRIGKNPLVLPNDDSAFGLIGLYFKLAMAAMFIYVLLFASRLFNYDYFLPIKPLEISSIKIVGIVLLVVSLAWTIIAQYHMKNSWRIGIDTETKTDLITNGLFNISRNPIFFGMTISMIGLFLVTPDAFTILFLILGYVLIQIQIRLEEEFLTKQHDETYLLYKKSVRRLI